MRPPVLLVILAVCLASGAEFPDPYNSEKTPGEPMPAEEAAAKWKVPPGFKVQVFASEPDVRNPIACAWDPRGRLWIAENYTYSERMLKFDPRLRDRVLIFEDADGDGHHDKRTVFFDDVQHLTSVEVGLGGVWLMAPPQLLFVPDKDLDDKPDGPAEVVLDGFDLPAENYHNFANGLRWGPDGWLYGRCGCSAPGRIGAPGTPEADRVPLAGGIWRYHPQRKVFEALCHGTTNPWGSDWNEVGEMFFTNTVNGHLWHMIPGAHYTRPHTVDPNPYVYELIDQHADHYHFDTGKGWQSSRDAGGGSDALGGGHAHCGAMIYLGDNWPDEYRGKLMTLNYHGRRINVDRLDREGSGYVGRHEPDIFFSADPFFRGIDLTYGPDGGVFILDWSDTGECHESTGVHRTSGRIYKITYGDPRRSSIVDLTSLNDAKLVMRQEGTNEWYVRMARRELVERSLQRPLVGKEAVAFANSRDSVERIRGLYTLHCTSNLDGRQLSAGLQDKDEHVRAAAITLVVDSLSVDRSDGRRPAEEQDSPHLLLGNLQELARREDSPLVRRALLSAAMRIEPGVRLPIMNGLINRTEDSVDHNIPLLAWYALQATFEKFQGCIPLDLLAECELPITRRLVARHISAAAENNPAYLDEIITIADSQSRSWKSDILAGLLDGFAGWRKAPKPASWDKFAVKVSDSGDAALIAKVRDLSVLFGDGRALDEVRKVALDEKVDLGARKAALQTLIDAKPDDLRSTCEKLLAVRFLNTVAAKGLAQFDDPAIGVKLAQSYRSFHPSERAAVIEALLTRPAFSKALLDEVAAGKIEKTDLSAYHARQIRSLNDPELTKRLAEVWGDIRESAEDKRALMAKLKAQLAPAVLSAADTGKGRVVFESICATCHTLYGQGGQIGPDLTGGGRANIDYLLENIVDPGAVVSADFRLNIVTLKDGRVLSGMISAKTDRTITLKTQTEPITIERSEIVKTEESPQSLMPEGLLSAFSETQVRDLFAYLMHPTQVPGPTPVPPK